MYLFLDMPTLTTTPLTETPPPQVGPSGQNKHSDNESDRGIGPCSLVMILSSIATCLGALVAQAGAGRLATGWLPV